MSVRKMGAWDMDRDLQKKLTRLRLVAITDSQVMEWTEMEQVAERALGAGLPALMLREKAMSDEALAPIAQRLREATREAGALLIVNRRLELAQAVAADGVHLGASGPSIREALDALEPGMLVGYSAHSIPEALGAFEEGAHYVFFSPIFETPSKRGILAPVGLEALAELTQKAPGPVLALGGITRENIAQVMKVGAHGVALIRAIFGAVDPTQATRELVGLIRK